VPPIEGETEDGAYKYRMGELDLSGFYVDKNDVKLELCRVQVRVSLCVCLSLLCVSGSLALCLSVSVSLAYPPCPSCFVCGTH
jgi:hypothetical protein